VRPILDAHAHFKNRVYRAIWNRIRQYWTEEKWVRVTDEEKNVKFVGLNKPVTMMEMLAKRIKQSGEQVDPAEMQALAADPQMQQIVGRENIPAEMDVDIILDEVPDFAALQSEQFATLAELAKAGMPIPPTAIIRASSLRDKEQVLNEMRGETEDGQSPQLVQAQGMIQQVGAALQESQAKIGELEGQVSAMKGDLSVKAAEIDLKRGELQLSAEELELRKAELALKVREAEIKAVDAETKRIQAQAALVDPQQVASDAAQAVIASIPQPERIDLSPIFGALEQMAHRIEALSQRGGRQFQFQYDDQGNVIGAHEVMPAPQAIQ
jgi:hypothetical protein